MDSQRRRSLTHPSRNHQVHFASCVCWRRQDTRHGSLSHSRVDGAQSIACFGLEASTLTWRSSLECLASFIPTRTTVQDPHCWFNESVWTVSAVSLLEVHHVCMCVGAWVQPAYASCKDEISSEALSPISCPGSLRWRSEVGDRLHRVASTAGAPSKNWMMVEQSKRRNLGRSCSRSAAAV